MKKKHKQGVKIDVISDLSIVLKKNGCFNLHDVGGLA